MLLTLTTNSLRSLLTARGQKRITAEQVPQLVADRLGLRGLIVDTQLLKGWTVEQLDALHTKADQAGCPCLVLRETNPIQLTLDDGCENTFTEQDELTLQRLFTVARAAHHLGCNSLSIKPELIDPDRGFEKTAMFLRKVMEQIDRMELNLLIEPAEQKPATEPGHLINLVKKVGGFRIGTMPNFAYAADTGDATSTLTQTAPFSSAILATCETQKKGKTTKKSRINLTGNIKTIHKIGYDQILAIDYTGKGDPFPVLDAAKEKIESILQ